MFGGLHYREEFDGESGENHNAAFLETDPAHVNVNAGVGCRGAGRDHGTSYD